MLARILSVPIALCLTLGMAHAGEADRTSLLDTVAIFETAMATDDFESVIALVPEKVFAKMAADLDVTSAGLAELVADQMQAVLTDVKIIEFDMETAALEISEAGGMAYAFLPTRTVLEVEKTRVETNSHTLALHDGGAWRLVRIDDAAQLRVLREVYPGFESVAFPKGTTKLLN